LGANEKRKKSNQTEDSRDEWEDTTAHLAHMPKLAGGVRLFPQFISIMCYSLQKTIGCLEEPSRLMTTWILVIDLFVF
jgi:hypothetical protein